jgi:hypothetical protein
MDKNINNSDDDLDFTPASLWAWGALSLWLIILALMWIGTILSFFISPALSSLIGFIVSSIFSAFVYFAIYKREWIK